MTDKHQKQGNTEVSEEENNYSLKGSFISVLILGAFLILSWAGVYAIFITR